MCKEDWTEFGQDYANVYTKTLLILQYVLPVSVLIFTYTSIGIVIWCHRIPGEAEDGRDLRIARSKRKVIYIHCQLSLILLHQTNKHILFIDHSKKCRK